MMSLEPSDLHDDDDHLAASLSCNVREDVATRVMIPAIILLSLLALAGFLVSLCHADPPLAAHTGRLHWHYDFVR
jgi:hypothetical protein